MIYKKTEVSSSNAVWHHPSSRFIRYIILKCPNDPGIPVTLNAHLRLNHCIFRPPEGLLIWLLAWYLNYNIIQPEQLLSSLWDRSHAFRKFGGAVTKLGLCLLNLLPYGYFKIHNLMVTDPTCLMNDNPSLAKQNQTGTLGHLNNTSMILWH